MRQGPGNTSGTPDPWSVTYVLSLGVSLVLLLFLSRDYGVTWDETLQSMYSEGVWRFYAGGFSYAGPAFDHYSLKYYGGLVELINAACVRLFPGVFEYDVRHGVGAVFFWILIVFASRIAWVHFSKPAGALTVFLLLLSPMIFGQGMNNSKDIPFAAFYIMAVHYMLLAGREYPFYTRATLAKLVAAVALAINVRPSGLLLIGYAGLYLLLLAVCGPSRPSPRQWVRLAAAAAGCGLAALVLGCLFWPWALESPLWRPIEVLAVYSKRALDMTALFGGRCLTASDLPLDYVPRWIAITTPLAVLLAILPGALAGPRRVTGWLAFCAVSPVALAALMRSSLYDGYRHLLFVYPMLVVLAVRGWDWLFARMGRLALGRLAAGLALAALCLDPLSFHLANHPNQAVYFSPLAGGTRGAFLNYELDFWHNSYKQALERLQALAVRQGRPLAVAVNLNPDGAAAQAAALDHVFIVSPDRAEYLVELMRGCPEDLAAMLGTGEIVDTVAADGVPLCLIKRVDRDARSRDLVLIRDALEAYRAARGSYPPSPEWLGVHAGASGADWIGGLVPDFSKALPVPDTPDGLYVYKSNGKDYKLMALDPDLGFQSPGHSHDLGQFEGKFLGFSTLAAKDWRIHCYDLNLIALRSLGRALEAYKAARGSYPVSRLFDGPTSEFGRAGPDWIKGLAPGFIPALPQVPFGEKAFRQQYLYKSDGTDYKLVIDRFADCPPATERNPGMIDPAAGCRDFGIWTPGAAAWTPSFFPLRQADLGALKNALEAYRRDHGSYPKSAGFDGRATRWGESRQDWIRGLVPGYLDKLPRDPRLNDDPANQYLYTSNGTDFKLIAHHPEDCEAVKAAHPELIDPVRDCRAYGYWTSGGRGW